MTAVQAKAAKRKKATKKTKTPGGGDNELTKDTLVKIFDAINRGSAELLVSAA